MKAKIWGKGMKKQPTGLGIVSLLFICFAATMGTSCTRELDDVKHERKLIRFVNGITEYRLTYNDFNKVQTIKSYSQGATLIQTQTNAYDKKGQLIETTITDKSEAIEWQETFTYKRGKLKEVVYKSMEPDGLTTVQRNHDVTEGENGISEYTITYSGFETPTSLIKWGYDGKGNIDVQEVLDWSTPDSIVRRDEFEFDEASSPFYGIQLSSPFSVFNTNKNNPTQIIETNYSGETKVHKLSYEYEDGYPISSKLEVYNGKEKLLRTSEEYYYYE